MRTYEYNDRLNLGEDIHAKHYFIADTHFGDESVFRFFNRPFKNVQDCDNFIISFLNDLVCYDNSTNDENRDKILWIIGDFTGDKADIFFVNEKYRKIRTNFDKIYLIRGNHDKLANCDYCGVGFSSIFKSTFVDFGDNVKTCLIHDPACFNPFVSEGEELIHGHIHYGNLSQNTLIDGFESNAINVSIEPWFYYLYDEIKNYKRLTVPVETHNLDEMVYSVRDTDFYKKILRFFLSKDNYTNYRLYNKG